MGEPSLLGGAVQIGGRGLGGLFAGELANSLIAHPIENAAGVTPEHQNLLHRILEGVGAGAGIGAVEGLGIGAVPGAIIGGLGGLGLGLYQNATATPPPAPVTLQSMVNDNPYLNDASKTALTTEYNLALRAGIAPRDALTQIAGKLGTTYAAQKQNEDQLRSILALQGQAANFFGPLYQSNVNSAGLVRDTKKANAQYLPENIRSAYSNQADIDYGNQMSTANALLGQGLNAPATYALDKFSNIYDQAAGRLASQAFQGLTGASFGTPLTTAAG